MSDKPGNDEISFSVEYASTARSKCKRCKEVVAKDALRFGIWKPSTLFDGKECSWHHWECFLARVDGSSKMACYGTADLAGATSLRWEDQVGLRKHYNEIVGSDAEMLAPFAEAGMMDINYFRRHEQNRMFWILRDRLEDAAALRDLKALAAANGLTWANGPAAMLSLIARCALYGVPPLCPECGGGRLAYSRSTGEYKCSAKTQWGRCAHVALTATLAPWRWPPDATPRALAPDAFDAAMADGSIGAIFNEWDVANRAARAAKAAAAAAAAAEEKAAAAARAAAIADYYAGSLLPLASLAFVIVGKPPSGLAVVKERITSYGGAVRTSVTKSTTAVIATPADLLHPSAAVTKARSLGIPFVREDYVDACIFVEGRCDAGPFLLDAPLAPSAAPSAAPDPADTPAARARVDPRVVSAGSMYVLRDTALPGAPWLDVLLNKADVKSGSNSEYKLQLLRSADAPGMTYFFTAWGRVGTSIGSHASYAYESYDEALDNFVDRFHSKTDNDWTAGLAAFVKAPGQFNIVLRADDAASAAPSATSRPSATRAVSRATRKAFKRARLHPRLVATVDHIFDPAVQAATLRALHIDTAKLPVKSLSMAQLRAAYKVLAELEKVVAPSSATAGASSSFSRGAFALKPAHSARGRVEELSSQYYTILPHEFGTSAPPPIATADELKAKMHEMQALTAIVAATAAERERNASLAAMGKLAPGVARYTSLAAALVPLPLSSVESRVLARYLNPPRSPAVRPPPPFSLELLDAFKIEPLAALAVPRATSPPPPPGATLLWHGSRVSNVVGILSTGALRIAPDEAPHTGYNFGKGIYASDVAAYAASYSFASPDADIGYVFAVELALGDAPKRVTEFGTHTADSLAATGHTSVVGCGLFEPAAPHIAADSGTVIPLGEIQRSSTIFSPLNYNEYVVYDESAAILKYLCRVKFHFADA